MSTETPPSEQPCSDCDLGDIESLACSAQRFQKQADVANESLAQMTDFKTKFATARGDYQKVRGTVQPDVDAAKSQLAETMETLRCKLDDDKKECLDEAFEKVVVAIKDCSPPSGCCAGPCDFSSDVGEDETAAQLAGRIDQYRRDVGVSADCFTSLIADQTDLPARVAKVKAEVASIAADLCAENGPKDYARLYARALVAEWELKPKQLWRGFPTVNDYVDCLCKCLTCALSGWEAIAVLEGVKVEIDCKAAAAAAACAKKRDDMVDEVMCEYVRCCPPEDEECEEPEKAQQTSE